MNRLGIITGMKREADAVRAAGAAQPVLIVTSGADPARAVAACRHLVEQHIGAMLSIGLAGGIDPALVPGDIVLATAVSATNGAPIATDAAWRVRLSHRLQPLGRVYEAAIIGVDQAAADPAVKRMLFLTGAAAAADMESHHAARSAAAVGLPMMALRVVVDAFDQPLPAAARIPLSAEGRMQPLAVALSALGHPAEWRDMLRLSRAYGCAMRRLDAACAALAPDFGWTGEKPAR